MRTFDPHTDRAVKLRLGDEIVQMRLTRNMGQEAFGRILGRTKSAVHRWEAAKTTPDLDEIAFAATALEHRFVCRLLTEPEAARLDRMEAIAEAGEASERDARLALLERVAAHLADMPLPEARAFVAGLTASYSPMARR